MSGEQIAFWVICIALFAWWRQGQQKPVSKPPQRDTVPDAPKDQGIPDEQIAIKVEVHPISNAESSRLTKHRRRLPTLKLNYTNTREETFDRVIEPYRSRATIEFFDAYCHFEGCKRSFRFDRVNQAIDLSNGEIITPLELFYLIHPKRRELDAR